MLILDEVDFKYGKKDLFRNLNLDLKPGNIYGLLGKNGAGKTTLLKIMAGLLFSSEGSCEFSGMDVSKRLPSFLEDVFFLPEEFYLPPIKGSLFLSLRAPFYPNFDYKSFSDYILDFGIELEKPLNTLSFGQKKKFLLSFGLATGTSLVIMDEPTNGLDIPSKTILRRIIAKSMDDNRIILISTHQVKDVENLIDPIIILEDGAVIFNQSTYDVSTNLSMGDSKVLSGDEIYTQEVLGGYQTVEKNITGEESLVDLELLFNSVITQPEKLNSVFNKGGSDE
ncbi:ABC transporter ATP-binding protein [Thiospirochaeta perfilievii]|uniref:ABC transporter ATP-binding protein n=1 Tax=Thiospirochaeta perfilievii TaxID=252967 RepID=A0A5C1QE06_9SPIO|nr:ABC transporter ATP-binding protein [Thiospirochaeta perfilievii]QEN05219.1 ABC transporter ATP-binding protein [Thiospirochaeta perfilievii]